MKTIICEWDYAFLIRDRLRLARPEPRGRIWTVAASFPDARVKTIYLSYYDAPGT